MTSVIDINVFPHIVDAILDYAVADELDPAWPLMLGTVCWAWQKGVSRKIGYHLLSTYYQIRPTDEDLRRWEELNDESDDGEGGRRAREPGPVEDRKYWHVFSNLGGVYEDFDRHGSLDFETLRPALLPGYDVCDMMALTSAPLVHEAKVLTVPNNSVLTTWHSETLATFCPQLHTLRVVTTGWRPPPMHYPYANTYVWFGAPDTHTYMRDLKAICHKDTRKLVFVNTAIRSSKPHMKLTKTPEIERPENVSEVVFFIFDIPEDDIEHWMQWSIDCRFRTTVVLVTQTTATSVQHLESSLGAPFLENDLVTVVTADSYKERVGNKTYKEETELYLSPVELANKNDIHTSHHSMTLIPMLWTTPWFMRIP